MGFKLFSSHHGGQQACLLRHRTPRLGVLCSVLKTECGTGRQVVLCRFVEFQKGPVNQMTIARNAVALVVSMWHSAPLFRYNPHGVTKSLPPLIISGGGSVCAPRSPSAFIPPCLGGEIVRVLSVKLGSASSPISGTAPVNY